MTYTATTPVGSHIVWPHFGSGSSTLTLAPTDPASVIASGTVTVTVTATDGDNASVTQSFSVTTSRQPTAVGTISDQYLLSHHVVVQNIASYFNDGDGDTLTYSVSPANTSAVNATVTTADTGPVVIFSKAGGQGSVTATITATDPIGLTATQTLTVYVGQPPTTVGTIPNRTVGSGWLNITYTIDVSSYFSDPNNRALTYSASSSNTSAVSASVAQGSTVAFIGIAAGTSTITVTATNTIALSVSSTFTVTVASPSTADTVSGLSSTEQLLLGQLLTYDTLIFNELHNGSDDSTDWVELWNVSNIDLPLDNWQLTIQTGNGTTVIRFPAGTVVSAGEILLITNTEMPIADASISAVVLESFALPQADFALILRSPTAFGDLAGNYFQTQSERPDTAPEFTVNTVWDRVQATVSGYRAEAWAVSTHRNGLGSPGYQPSAVTGDLNNDGVVNILDLVLVASQFGTTGITAADLNGDNTVNIQDLVLVANALNNVGAAPTATQSAAATVNNWLNLARQNASEVDKTAIPAGFSYERGIAMLEELARALTPDTTALLANYPNPFNPETWIPYQLSKAADVTITIYASDGNVVRTLAIGHRDVGMYKTRSQAAYWDGTNEMGESVASGVYFYTLTAGEFTATRKMLILK